MKKKEKVYIAGPISSDLDHYREKFSAAEQLLTEQGYIVLNPATAPIGLTRNDYMRLSFAMIDAADMLVLLDGWEESPGANLERSYAIYTEKTLWHISHFRPPVQVECIVSPATVDPKPKAPSRTESMFGPRNTWKIPPQTADGYKGFLLIRCPECGEVRGFCAKDYVQEVSCRKCGAVVPLDHLIPANVNCAKCGRHFRYKTNVGDNKPVPFKCLNCGAPVDLELNGKGTALVTMVDRGELDDHK